MLSNIHKGLLSLSFALAALSTAQPSHGQTAPAAPTIPNDPLPAASQRLEAMRAYYDQLSPDDTPVLMLDADTIQRNGYNATAAELAALVARDGSSPSVDAMTRVLMNLRLAGNPYMTLHPELSYETAKPVAWHNLNSASGLTICLALVSDLDFPALYIDGLSREQTIRFINHHEFSHCNTGPDNTAHDPADEVPGEDTMPAFTQAYYQEKADDIAAEAIADLRAVAYMIARDGDDPILAQRVAEWRTRRYLSENTDLAHFSTIPLLGLAAAIEGMGLEKFRALPDQARDVLCAEIVAEQSLTAGTLALLNATRYGIDATRAISISPKEEAVAAAILALRGKHAGLHHDDFELLSLSEEESQAVLGWDPQGALRQLATPNGGAPDRPGLLAARARLLDHLREQMLAEPENPVHGARLIRLHAAVQIELEHLQEQAQTAAALASYTAPSPPEA